ncbi:hypothetical protein BH20CHL6_BH20CHL6_06660 [soil metagenome]
MPAASTLPRRRLPAPLAAGLLALTMVAGAVSAAPVTPDAGMTVGFTRLTTPIYRGSRATAAVSTKPGASCTITVTYKSGVSRAAGLGRKTASSTGRVSWTWTVGSSTTPGRWPVKVRCTKNGVSASATKYIKVLTR